MTKLTINVLALDDAAALRVLTRLDDLMRVYRGEKCEIALNDAGYTSGHADGSGNVMVIHLPSNMKAEAPK